MVDGSEMESVGCDGGVTGQPATQNNRLEILLHITLFSRIND